MARKSKYTVDRNGVKRLRRTSIISEEWMQRNTHQKVDESLDREFGATPKNPGETYAKSQRKKMYLRYFPAGS